MNNNNNFNDQDIMNDCLTSLKKVTSDYNTFASEVSHVNLKQDVMNLLKDAHEAESMVYEEMASRGWYKTKAASDQEIQKARQSFTQLQNKTRV